MVCILRHIKEYVISSIVESSRREWMTLSARPERLIANHVWTSLKRTTINSTLFYFSRGIYNTVETQIYKREAWSKSSLSWA